MNRTLKEIGKEISGLVEEANRIYKAFQKLNTNEMQLKYNEILDVMTKQGNLEVSTIEKYNKKLNSLKSRIDEKEQSENDYKEITKSFERHLLDSDIGDYKSTRMEKEILKFDLYLYESKKGANKTAKRLNEIYDNTDIEIIMDLINYLCKFKSKNKVSIKDGYLIKGDDLDYGKRLQSSIANKSSLKGVLFNIQQNEFLPSEMLKYYAKYCLK